MTISRNRTLILRFIFPSICASLGTWQIYRWQNKQIILKELEESINSNPLKVDSLKSLRDTPLKMVIDVESLYDRALLGPRGISSTSGYGYTLFEKAKLQNGEIVILNRGNLALKDVNSCKIPFANGNLTIVQDKEEKRPLFARPNSPDRILWKNWDILKEALKIAPSDVVHFVKVIDEMNSINGILKGHQLFVDQIPNRHVEYIATWYSLAAFSILMSFLRK